MAKRNNDTINEEDVGDAEWMGFDKGGNILYKGYCSIALINGKKAILVKPSMIQFVSFTANLKQHGWNYYVKNNCIFVFAGSTENKDFVLVFRDLKCCKDAYDSMFPETNDPVDLDTSKKKKRKSGIKDVTSELHRRFLIPICNAIRKTKDEKLIRVFQDWLGYFKEKATETYMDFAKEQNVFHLLYPHEVQEDGDKQTSRRHSNSHDDNSNVKTLAAKNKSKHKDKENQKDGKKHVNSSRNLKISDIEGDSGAETSTQNKSKSHTDKSPNNAKQRVREQQSSDDGGSPGDETANKSKSYTNKSSKKQRAEEHSNSENGFSDENTAAKKKSKNKSRGNQKDGKQQVKQKQINEEDSGSDDSKRHSNKSTRVVKQRSRKLNLSNNEDHSEDESSDDCNQSSKHRHGKEVPVTPAKKKKLLTNADSDKKEVSFDDDQSDNERNSPQVCSALTPFLKAASIMSNQQAESQSEGSEFQSQSSNDPLKTVAKLLNASSSTPKLNQSSKKTASRQLLETFKFAGRQIEEEDFRLERDEKNDIADGILLVLHLNNKNRCYKYFLEQSQDIYICRKCPNVTAKLYTKNNGDRHLVLGKHEHSCKTEPFYG